MRIRFFTEKTAQIAFLALCALLLCLFSRFPVHASAAGAIHGPSDVRPGDTITLTFSVTGTGLLGATCNLAYNDNHLSLQKMEQRIDEPWIVENAGNAVLAYDNAQTAPIDGETELFAVTFKVKGTVEPGTEISITVTSIVLSDGVTEERPADVVWTVALGQPRSSDATLSALTAENATLSPEFDPSITAYTATVPYSVRSLDFSIDTTHEQATYRISGNTLSVGNNKISIRVTAEDGSTRTYRITVTREQDPSYVPSNDASLESLTVSDGKLSPAFAPDVTEYVIYLPNEVTSLTLHGEPNDRKGSVSDVSAELSEGQNKLVIIGIAEDGTTLAYNVIAVRLPVYSPDSGPIWPPTETLPPETTPPVTTPPETKPPETTITTEPITTAPNDPPETPGDSRTESQSPPFASISDSSAPDTQCPRGQEGVSAPIAVLIAILGIGAGFGGAIILTRLKEN